MKQLIKLTEIDTNKSILIGTESIISVQRIFHPEFDSNITKIQSRGAMVSTFFVTETVEEIYNLFNS